MTVSLSYGFSFRLQFPRFDIAASAKGQHSVKKAHGEFLHPPKAFLVKFAVESRYVAILSLLQQNSRHCPENEITWILAF